MEQHSTAAASRSPLVPIPRNGLRGSSGILLFLAWALSLFTVGIGLSGGLLAAQSTNMIAEVISAASLVLLFLYTWKIAGRAKGMLILLLLPTLLLAYVTDSFVPAATLLALVCAVTLGSLTLSIISKKQAVWVPIAPLLAYVATLLLCRDAVMAAAALIPVPAAWALSVGTRRSAEQENGPTRVGVICLASFATVASIAAFVALVLYRTLGSLEPDTLASALDTVRESIIVWITSLESELPPEATDEMRAMFSRESAEYMVNGTINLLLGYVVAVANLLVAVSQLLLHAALVSFGCGESLSDRVRVFRMSAISCWIFPVAYLLALIGNGETSTLWGVVAHNLYIILSPGLAFAGMLRLIAGITSRRPGCFSTLALFLAPLLFIIAQPVLAAVEIFGRAGAFIASKTRPPEDGSPMDTPPDQF